jgi:hypothetical protein
VVLGWLKPRPTSVYALVARKSYGKAIELLKLELQKNRHDRRLRTQLADVFAMAGKEREAVEIYGALSDELALQGQAAQAIAVLKKIQALSPGREDVEEKLAYLIKQQDTPAPDPWVKRRALAADPSLPPGSAPSFEIGMEGPLEDEEVGGSGSASAPSSGAEVVPGPSGPADSGPAPSAELSDEQAREEIMALVESAFAAGDGLAPTASAMEPAGATTPLFQGLETDALVAVMRGLVLRTFVPGEIVVTEGEPGQSLFVITSGTVRAYVRSAEGRSVQVRELAEGDFFGEASVLAGGQRTATITAASRCEMLELDQVRLTEIGQAHPQVMAVMRAFHEQRLGSSLDASARQARG